MRQYAAMLTCALLAATVFALSWPATAQCPRVNKRDCLDKPVKPAPSPIVQW